MLKLMLPQDKRRSLVDRLEDLLADPRASSCTKNCKICSRIKPKTAQAALVVWDDFARAGMYPIDANIIFKFLESNNLAGGEGRGKKKVFAYIAHRRNRILNALVREDKKKWGIPIPTEVLDPPNINKQRSIKEEGT